MKAYIVLPLLFFSSLGCGIFGSSKSQIKPADANLASAERTVLSQISSALLDHEDSIIPVELEIMHRGSLTVEFYEFLVFYQMSPSTYRTVFYYAPPHPEYHLLMLEVKRGLRLKVKVWIKPPKNCYRFVVQARVLGRGYRSLWSDPVEMVSEF